MFADLASALAEDTTNKCELVHMRRVPVARNLIADPVLTGIWRIPPGRAKPYWSGLQRLRTNAAATSERCVQAWNLAAAELRPVYSLTLPNSVHPAWMSWHERWVAGS